LVIAGHTLYTGRVDRVRTGAMKFVTDQSACNVEPIATVLHESQKKGTVVGASGRRSSMRRVGKKELLGWSRPRVSLGIGTVKPVIVVEIE